MANCISKSNRKSNRGRRTRKQARKPRNAERKKKTINNLTTTRLKKVAPETETKPETRKKDIKRKEQRQQKYRKCREKLKRGKIIKSQSQSPINRQRQDKKHKKDTNMTRLLVYLNDIKCKKLL